MECNPMFALGVQVLLSILVIGFTGPSSFVRPASLPLTAFCMTLVIQNSMSYMVRAPWAALMGGYSVSFFLQFVDVAVLSKWSFDELGPADSSHAKNERKSSITFHPVIPRFVFGVSILSNFRFINTTRSLSNIPRFSSQNPSYIPTRKEFLVGTSITSIVSYLLLDLLTSTADPEIASKYLTTANVAFFTRLADVTTMEILIRISATVCLGISMNCVQGGIYSTLGFFSVLLGISEPKHWPPFYGPMLKAYTLRNFWAVYWHQMNTRKLLSISNYLNTKFHRAPPNSLIARYLRLVHVFALSGLMHLLIDLASGIPALDSGALKFFMVQIFGILVEDIFLKMYSLMGPRTSQDTADRFLGYIWVLAFLSWSVPAYLYPILGRAGPEHSTVPFSVVMYFMHGD